MYLGQKRLAQEIVPGKSWCTTAFRVLCPYYFWGRRLPQEGGNVDFHIFLCNLFTFFASAYHINNFSKDPIHLRKIKESGQQKPRPRGPTGSEVTAKQPQEAGGHSGALRRGLSSPTSAQLAVVTAHVNWKSLLTSERAIRTLKAKIEFLCTMSSRFN